MNVDMQVLEELLEVRAELNLTDEELLAYVGLYLRKDGPKPVLTQVNGRNKEAIT